jgi:D-alanine-D-alanine ligase
MTADEQPPGVVVLFNRSERVVKGEAKDLLAEQGVIACAHAVADALRSRDVPVVLAPISGDAENALKPFPPTTWVVFNLGEGMEGRLFEEVRIAWALEAMGYRFTGADAMALALSTHKARAKEILARAGVATPAWRLFRHPSEVSQEVLDGLPFPMIVKPVAEDASQGVSGSSVVHSIRELHSRVAYLVECYRQAALVEEFVDGREFNVSVWGDPPEVLPIGEIDFSAFDDPFQRIVSFAAKWETESFDYQNTPVVCPAHVSASLKERIERTALMAWSAIGCRGYARVDMRVSPDGIPYVIEVNCNPDISPDAGFFRAARTAGYGYEDMVFKVLEMTLRQGRTYDRAGTATGWAGYPEHYEADGELHGGGSRMRGGTLERIPSGR